MLITPSTILSARSDATTRRWLATRQVVAVGREVEDQEPSWRSARARRREDAAADA